MARAASATGTSRRCSRRSSASRRCAGTCSGRFASAGSGNGSEMFGDLLQAPARQGSSLEDTEHRPWPPPERRPWVMGQTWDDLLFAHWRVAADAVRELVPRGLDVEERDGSAWLGVT